MSIAGSLSSALSGLTVAARAAEIVSSNIANATTEGYGRRVLQTTSRMVGSTGQGVTITGVLRIANMAIVGDRRLAQAGTGDRDVRASFYKRLEDTLGTPDLPHSLNGRIAAFDTSLIEAASRPESEARLSRVVETARVLVSQIDTASQSIQASRASIMDAAKLNGLVVDKSQTAQTSLEELLDSLPARNAAKPARAIRSVPPFSRR